MNAILMPGSLADPTFYDQGSRKRTLFYDPISRVIDCLANDVVIDTTDEVE